MIETAEAPVVLRQVTCDNALCPEVVRTKKAQWLGEVVGTEAHLPCPRCHRTTHWRSATLAVARGPRVDSRH